MFGDHLSLYLSASKLWADNDVRDEGLAWPSLYHKDTHHSLITFYDECYCQAYYSHPITTEHVKSEPWANLLKAIQIALSEYLIRRFALKSREHIEIGLSFEKQGDFYEEYIGRPYLYFGFDISLCFQHERLKEQLKNLRVEWDITFESPQTLIFLDDVQYQSIRSAIELMIALRDFHEKVSEAAHEAAMKYIDDNSLIIAHLL